VTGSEQPVPGDLMRLVFGVLLLVASILGAESGAEAAEPPHPAPGNDIAVAGGEPAVARYLNRPITVFRASILSRSPAERAAAAAANLERLVEQGSPAAVSTRPFLDSIIVSVGGHDVFVLTPQDVDGLSGETLEHKVSESVSNLQVALAEGIELQTTRSMVTNAAEALVGTGVFVLLLWGAKRIHGRLLRLLPGLAERQLAKLSPGDLLVRESRAAGLLGRALDVAFGLFALVAGYWWLTFTLRRFPYTRPLGESLWTFLFSRVATLGLRILEALPDLCVVALIVIVTRYFVRLSNHLFQAVEEQRFDISGFYPETAYATRRIVTILLWLLAIMVAYPYLPGSNSDVFKGLSLFVGLVISLSSSGIVNQMMSGLLITYSRAVRTGDLVKIGDVEGKVMQVGALSVKVKTPRGEEVTIPNAVVVANVTKNYSRFADREGVYVPSSVSIGYDAPWRQVRALLLLAAERTPGICRRPEPVVRQSRLRDFYVEYTLLVCLEEPHQRGATLSALHGNILDTFNDSGVQIMSPHYEADPSAPKLVPRSRWYAPSADPSTSSSSAEPIPEPVAAD
jgi:small-conductance mechanosensitive channel